MWRRRAQEIIEVKRPRTHLGASILAEARKAESDLWEERLAKSRIWGELGPDNHVEVTIPLPMQGHRILWPRCFAVSSLFSANEGPRKQLSGQPFSLDGLKMHYRGEELRVATDQTLLMAMMFVAGKHPCGSLIEIALNQLETALGSPLPKLGMPIAYYEIARTLWRLANCVLTVDAYRFEGPILTFVDAREAPQCIRLRFNPDFARLFYPDGILPNGVTRQT